MGKAIERRPLDGERTVAEQTPSRITGGVGISEELSRNVLVVLERTVTPISTRTLRSRRRRTEQQEQAVGRVLEAHAEGIDSRRLLVRVRHQVAVLPEAGWKAVVDEQRAVVRRTVPVLACVRNCDRGVTGGGNTAI